MSCDSTHQRRAHDEAIAGAARLAKNPAECICDCEVVAAINRADHDKMLNRWAQRKPLSIPAGSLSK